MASDIYAIVLAAGHASRFGGKKLTRMLCGKPLLVYALGAAQTTFPGRVVLVVGHDADDIVEAAGELANIVVTNPEHATGQASSIAKGVAACGGDADAVVILLADQPLIASETLKNIIDSWSGDGSEIVVSVYDIAQGPPVLFGKNTFEPLRELKGDAGAKTLITSGQFKVTRHAIGALGFDVDTKEDLAFAAQQLGEEK